MLTREHLAAVAAMHTELKLSGRPELLAEKTPFAQLGFVAAYRFYLFRGEGIRVVAVIHGIDQRTGYLAWIEKDRKGFDSAAKLELARNAARELLLDESQVKLFEKG